MFNKLTKIFLFLSIVYGTFCYADVFHTADRIYIDPEDFSSNIEGNEFHLHIGQNVWLITHTIHRDCTGMFAFESYLKKMKGQREYQRSWKCPYCFNYWPIGTPCQKTDCPSKYK